MLEEPGASAQCDTVQQYKLPSFAGLVLPASYCSAVLPVFGPEKGKAIYIKNYKLPHSLVTMN